MYLSNTGYTKLSHVVGQSNGSVTIKSNFYKVMKTRFQIRSSTFNAHL